MKAATIKTYPLYKKVGRKYIPVEADAFDLDYLSLKLGEFCLLHQADGLTRYVYQVTPDNVGLLAAMQKHEAAMEMAVMDALAPIPKKTVNDKKWSKKQLELISKFKKDMVAAGGFMPTYWEITGERKIVSAAMKAILGAVK